MKLNRLLLAIILTVGGFGWAQAQCTADLQVFSNGGCNYTAYDSSFVAPADSVVSYTWNWGDGTTTTGQVSSHLYSNSGTYGLCLTISTMMGCTSTHCDTIVANCSGSTCNANFMDSTSVFGGTQFYDYSTTSSGNITSWFWSFGDGATSTQQNPIHTYGAPGNYVACLTITTSLGCTDQTCYTVTVGASSCSVSYTAVNNSGNVVNFTSNASGNAPYAFVWDFGDGSSGATAANPIHTYPGPGVYVACVTMTDNMGCSSTFCDSVAVGNGGGCSTTFSAFNTTGSTVDFTASSTGIAPFTYVWDFGDGSSGSGATPQHTYANGGGYVVCLISMDAGGCTATYCDSILVGNPAGGCSVSFTSANTTGGTVAFAASASGTAPFQYVWDFGDGNTGIGANPQHTYANSGGYIVCLVMSDANGCTATYCDSVVAGGPVLGGCAASFVWYPDSSGQYSVIVVNTATGSNLNYFWDFGDGGSSNQPYPQHVYAGPGTYNVCLSVWNNTCADTTCQAITITNKVNVPFSINVVSQNPTAVDEELVSGVSVYPNPFGDRFELDLNLDRSENVDIELVNIHGAVVGHLHQGQMAAGAHHLRYDTPSLAAGLYLIRIKAGDQVHTQKILHR